ERQGAERVIPVAIVASRDQDELRVEAPQRRQHDIIIELIKTSVAGPVWQRKIERGPVTILKAVLLLGAGAWVERRRVGRAEEHMAVVVEAVLRAIAVM